MEMEEESCFPNLGSQSEAEICSENMLKKVKSETVTSGSDCDLHSKTGTEEEAVVSSFCSQHQKEITSENPVMDSELLEPKIEIKEEHCWEETNSAETLCVYDDIEDRTDKNSDSIKSPRMAESDPSEKHQDLQHKLKEALCRLDTERRLREDAERRIALLQEAHKNDSQLSEAGSSTVEENDKGPVWDFFASIPEYPKDNSEHDLDTTAKNKLVDAPSPPIPGTSTLEPLSSSLEESTNNEQSNDSQTCEWSPPTNGHHRKGSLPRHTRMTEYDREMMQLYREKHAMQMRHEEELHQENIQKAKLEQKKLMLEVQLLEKQLKTPEN